MNALQTYLRAVDGLNRAVKTILAVLIAVMSILVIAQVVCRLARIQLPWSEEVARYLLIYITFIGSGYMVRFDLMMSVTFIRDKFSPGQRRVISIIAHLIMLCFFALLFVFALYMLQRVRGQLTPAMQISMSFPYAGIVIGAALMIVNVVTVTIERLLGKGETA